MGFPELKPFPFKHNLKKRTAVRKRLHGSESGGSERASHLVHLFHRNHVQG